MDEQHAQERRERFEERRVIRSQRSRPDGLSEGLAEALAEEASLERLSSDTTQIVFDGDELIEHVNGSRSPTVFRWRNGEEVDWDAVIQSTLTGGKPIGDPDVDGRATTIQWAVATLMSQWSTDPATGRKQRRYQLGVEHDSDAMDGRFSAGVTQWVWLQLPRPKTMGRVEFARQWAEAHCFNPRGVGGMAHCLSTWLGQGITHIRVQYLVPAEGRENAFPQAQDYERVEKFHGGDEARLNMQLVQASSRARRAASTEEYVPEHHSEAINVADIEDVSL